MPSERGVTWFMAQETRALLTRLALVKSFALHETMVPAAALSPAAQTAIERFLASGRRELRIMAHEYLLWLEQGEGQRLSPAEVRAAHHLAAPLQCRSFTIRYVCGCADPAQRA
jgi:hypothetical protein